MVYVKRSENNFNREEIFWAGIKKVALVLVFQVLTLFGYSTVYYVSSSSGSDGNSGTSVGSAWRSLSKVNSFTPKPGDQILFKRGDEWTGTITVRGSGTSGSPIIYGAYGTGDKPKIYGSEKITGWTRHSGNIWKAKVNREIIQLFINGKRAQLARYPKTGYFDVTAVRNSTQFESTSLNTGIDYSGAIWVGRTNPYILTGENVIKSEGKLLTLSSAPSGSLGEKEGFFLCNKLEFLTLAGEWYFDSSSKTVYVWMPGSDSPANYILRGSVEDYNVNIERKNHITIKDLELLDATEHGIYINQSDYVTISTNRIINSANSGINTYYWSDHSNITGNYIYGANSYGISLYNNPGANIQDNVIDEIGQLKNITRKQFKVWGYGIRADMGEMSIEYNRITNCGYIGISFYNGEYEIKYNYINGACQVLEDGGGIYTYNGYNYSNPGAAGSEVVGNIILNVHGNPDGKAYDFYQASGIFFDNGVHDILVKDNLIAGATLGVFLHQGGDNIVDNNTIVDCLLHLHVSREYESNSITNNIIYATDRHGYPNWWGSNTHQRIVFQKNASTKFDFNTYVAPYTERDVFANYVDFKYWQTDTGQDRNSTYDGTDMKSGESEKLFYNSSKESVTYNVNDAKVRDIYGNAITNSFTLKPFTSKIIIGSGLSAIAESNKNYSDDVAPVITSFTVIPTTASLTVPVANFFATDNIAVTGYKLTESSNVPNPDESGWSAVPLTWYTFSGSGSKVLYAWAKDAAGNVSAAKSVQVSITPEFDSEFLGNTEVYAGVTTAGNRRAIPVTIDESGKIESISIYHNGGNGNMLLGVYSDESGNPGTLLGRTTSTTVNSSEGWQTISLSAPASVSLGQTVWLSWVFENNPGIRYATGQPSRAESSEGWSSGMPSAFGSSNFFDYTYSVYCSVAPLTEFETNIAGNEDVFTGSTSMGTRRAVPVTMNESGFLESISIYHNGGTGNMILGAYTDQGGSPASLLGVTPSTVVNSTEGWQTVYLQSPVGVSYGQTVWLSWVFENNPGIRYTIGKPGRAESYNLWSSGMPSSFGPSNFADYNYSVYCTVTSTGEYVTNTAGNKEVFSSRTTAGNRRAIPVTFNESGNIESISIYHNGGNGKVLLGVYTEQNGTPESLLGTTPSTEISSTEGWQTVLLNNSVPVNSGQTVWLSWVFENNPGVRYKTGQPYRAESSETWSSGMPATFGSVNFVGYTYSVYCTYRSDNNLLKGAEITETAAKTNTIEEEEEKPLFDLDKNDLIVYPNPAQTFVQVEFPDLGGLKTEIKIIDNSGRVLVDKLVETQTTRIDINHISPGLYFIKMINSEINISKKFIISR
jgi:hypothetical protein